MGQRSRKTVRATIVALAVAMTLSGCTIPFVNVEVPIDLPTPSSINLPDIDLSGLNLPRITLPIGVTTSVDEARQTTMGGKASTVDESALVQPGYLTAGVKVSSSMAPLCVEGEGGSIYGLDVDVAAALASELGLRVRFVPVTDESSLGSECDVIMGSTTDNPDHISVAGVYVESAACFFQRGESSVPAVTDLGGKSVGVQGGSVSETVLNQTALKMSQKGYVNLNEAFDALAAGEVDYVLCEAYPGAYLAALKGGISFAGSLEPPETSGVAVLTSNDELASQVHTAFEAISQNGVLESTRARWVGSMPVLTTDSQIKDVPKGDADASTTASGQGTESSSDGSEAGSNAITSV